MKDYSKFFDKIIYALGAIVAIVYFSSFIAIPLSIMFDTTAFNIYKYGIIGLVTVIVLYFVCIFVLEVLDTNVASTNTPKKNIKSNVSSQNSLSLPMAFWGLFMGGNAIFNLIFLIAKEKFYMLLIILSTIWATFAIMKVFETAKLYKAEKEINGKNYGWATAAKVVSTLLFFSGLGNLLLTVTQ